MSDSIEKQLISAFAAAWNETAPVTLKRPSALSLLALREVSGDQMSGALAVAVTWSAGFVAPCSGGLPGVLICLFKSEDSETLDRAAGRSGGGGPKPGARALVGEALAATSRHLGDAALTPVTFGPVTYLDFTTDESCLARISGDTTWFGTFSLSVGTELDSQALLLYAPHGSLDALSAAKPAAAVATTPAASTAPATGTPTGTRRLARRDDPRNIERLLDVELEVIVRFGTTTVPLRDVVQMGTGSMIELNRTIDEPVELLVNDRPLARGEVVVVDGYYGVRITEIGTPAERTLSIS
jgi:flagellar motor switch protein FliN